MYMQVFETLLWESKAAWRAALRRPTFLVLCAAILCIGIAACSVTFALVDDFVLTPPCYTDPSRLVVIGPPTSTPYLTTVSPQQYQALSGLPELGRIGAVSFWRLSNLKSAGDPILAPSRPVSRSFLETLGVHPVVGRNFSEEEDRPGSDNTVIISDRLWAKQFGRDQDILRRWIKLDGKARAIVGVLPRDFQFLEPLDVLTPLGLPPNSRDYGNHLIVTARLAPGVSVARASLAVNSRINSRRAEFGMKMDRPVAFVASPLWAGLAGLGRSTALMFFAFGMCLLALVGANVTNLLSLRSMLTHRDRVVRRALGANALRLTSPAVAEGLLIGIAGVAFGLILAENAFRVIASYIPQNWMNAGRGLWLSNRTRGLAFALGSFLPVFSGFLAARGAGERKIAPDLLAGQRVSWSRGSRIAAQVLVIGQIALAAGLLQVSTALATSLIRFLHADLGLQTAHVLTFAVAPSSDQYPDGAAVRAFADEVVGRLGIHAGGKSAAASWNTPIGEPFAVPVRLPDSLQLAIQYRAVTPGYFNAFSIPLLRGRTFADLDQNATEAIAIVNDAFQSRYLHGQALDQHIELSLGSNRGAVRIVGVVADTKQAGPSLPSEPMVYVPLSQVPDGLVSEMRQFLEIHFFLPTHDEAAFASEARSILREISPEQVATDVGPLTDTIRKLVEGQELDLKIAAAMTLLAILVASCGIYSVVSLSVASRKRDLGIKAALGASPRAIALDVLKYAAKQIGAGLALGAIAGAIASSYLRTAITDFEPTPWAPAALAFGLLLCAGVCACLAPARRAAHVDPAAILQEE
jgi:putative ABC transport system permease protein